MSEFYHHYPEFIDTDPRTNRPACLGYPISADMMELRHLCMFPPETLKDKSILDLGSCVGYTGAWALHHGAKRYHGVEFSTDFVNISRNNLKKHFANKNWLIEHSSIEDFFKSSTEKFDIVVASGVIYSFTDPTEFLDNIAKYGNTCIIETSHPWNTHTKSEAFGIIPKEILQSFRESPYWEIFIEYEPFTTLSRRQMVVGTQQETALYTGCGVSLGYLRHYMGMLGYDYDPTVNGKLKKLIPSLYSPLHRYAAKFSKSSRPAKPQGYINSLTSNAQGSIIKKSWNDIK